MSGAGYIQPSSSQGLPGGLTLAQFIQTVLVGVSGISGTLVRPRWQVNPPKNPDIDINWMAFGVKTITPDTYGYVVSSSDTSSTYQRQEGIEVELSLYGPDALENAVLISDGFQIPQNRDALKAANMNFTEASPPLHVPDLLNERFVDRVVMSVFLRRQVQRTYSVPTILSSVGTVHTVVGNEEYLLDWNT